MSKIVDIIDEYIKGFPDPEKTEKAIKKFWDEFDRRKAGKDNA